MSTKKTVLITGAGSGIGRAMAIEGARRGYALILTGRTVANLEATRDMIGVGDVTLVPGDVTTRDGRAAMVAATGGRLDILINNAGVLAVGHLRDLDDDRLNRVVATNLIAPMAVARDLLPSLEAAQGRVVNVGSVFGDIAYPFFAAYSATKFGLRGFSDALRREMSGRGVGVTYIAPRATQTAAEAEFAALVEPMDMTMDMPARVATQAWDAIEAGKRESFPRGKERLFVKIQRLFPSIIDKAVGAQARDPKTLRALETVSKA
ncbi:SDR family NAD(P)-dependent oxidoreductase [Rhodovulum sp. FJ3]|uniref:SDR family NAD(P)-dependent oxidoreductase n=1 Tax=Rhodovulum sp. FJ3 TaxID=3079053 RepID=UPI00293DEADF|nr:SDR family NAD(P)-dependent oxidoreductase [Rhodovulum sp. FJ3]MDV4167341.1 SDR family NAD(P)-dependent oxidoreductase [Rhodovulum sp. FJ3]